ncbi:GmrSD restriction endonuclease domain-containing protein [Peribacillus frigoritolerans]
MLPACPIGNLTLLGSELNITASNFPFLDKKKNMSNPS